MKNAKLRLFLCGLVCLSFAITILIANRDSFSNTKKTRTANQSNLIHVGVDIVSGNYKLIADHNGGYYYIYSDSKCEKIVSYSKFDSSVYITIEQGQFIKLINCKIIINT